MWWLGVISTPFQFQVIVDHVAQHVRHFRKTHEDFAFEIARVDRACLSKAMVAGQDDDQRFARDDLVVHAGPRLDAQEAEIDRAVAQPVGNVGRIEA